MSTPINRCERPPVVTVVFVGSFLWALAFFAIYGMQLVEVQAGRDKSATVLQVILAIAVLGVWCVGAARLFLMKPDAWLWMTASFAFGLPLTVLDIMGHRVQGNPITWPIIAGVVRYIIALGIIYYSYRLFNDPPEKD